jgi:hypothetical protein
MKKRQIKLMARAIREQVGIDTVIIGWDIYEGDVKIDFGPHLNPLTEKYGRKNIDLIDL